MTLNDITLDFIVSYCKEHKEVAWLQDLSKQTTKCKVYPRIKRDGKSVADKTQEPVIEERKISFIEIRNAFVSKFMPELAPKAGKPKKPTMYEIIAALEREQI